MIWTADASHYLQRRGIFHSTVDRFGLRLNGRDSIEFPYQDGFYRERYARYLAHPYEGRKIISPKGSKTHLFAVRGADSTVCVIAEGEWDVMTLWQCGIHAVGIQGVTNWKDEWAFLFRNCEYVILALDADEAGDKAARRIDRDLRRHGVDTERAELPPGTDINDLYLEGGSQRVFKALGNP